MHRSLRIISLSMMVIAFSTGLAADDHTSNPPATPRPIVVEAATNEIVIVRGGKQYKVDLDAATVQPVSDSTSSSQQQSSSAASSQAAPSAQANPADADVD